MVDKNTITINIPDYKDQWTELYNSKKNELIEVLQNLTSVTLICPEVTAKELYSLAQGIDYSPTLLSINRDRIISRYYPEELIDLILNNLNPDITHLTINSNMLKNNNFLDKLKGYKNLYEITITGDYKLTKEDIFNILKNPNIGIIHTSYTSDIDITNLPDAIKYVGNTESIIYDGALITNDRIYTSDKHFFYTDDIPYNVSFIMDYIVHNSIKSNSKYINIIDDLNGDSIHYSIETGTLEYYGYFDKAENIINEFNNAGLPVNKLYLDLENQDYDLTPLYNLNCEVEICYDDINTTTLEGFESMRSTIDYFKNLIVAYPLSPIEQVTFAYDIIKSFKYEDDDKERVQARSLDKIIKSGKIVCVGYALFLKQVLSELGFKIEDYSVLSLNEDGTYDNKKSNHRRNIIRIDDDKYNIHGIFALDPTWDRNQIRYQVKDKNGRIHPDDTTEDNEILKQYQTIISYIHFLVTKNEYQAIFEDKKLPALFRFDPKLLVHEITHKPRYSGRSKEVIDKALQIIQSFFDEDEYDQIEDYINVERPSLDVFKEILFNVERAEGYTQEDFLKAIKEIEEYNNAIYEYEGTPVFTNHEGEQFTSEDIKPKRK